MIISIRTTKSFDIENLLLALSITKKNVSPRLIESWHQDTDFDLELDPELGYPLSLSAPCHYRIAIDSEGSPPSLLTWILDECQHLDPSEKYIQVEFNDDECKSHGFFEERFLNSRLPMTGTTFNLQDLNYILEEKAKTKSSNIFEYLSAKAYTMPKDDLIKNLEDANTKHTQWLLDGFAKGLIEYNILVQHVQLIAKELKEEKHDIPVFVLDDHDTFSSNGFIYWLTESQVQKLDEGTPLSHLEVKPRHIRAVNPNKVD